ncbi:Vgr related protein [Sphingomonas antarctica]|uniref:vgr related protein n=1 Tax=Sphingomonas antarctica TaxID=2040274 RepID=UPI0039EA579F
MESRGLTDAEVALTRSVFGDAIDTTEVRINNRKWAFFQPRDTIMAPDGQLWLHPKSELYCADFSQQPIDRQGLFIHEMTHVWQRQQGIYLPLARHPFCRYGYAIKPGKVFRRYGIEQQAEIVRHAFLLRHNRMIPGAPPLAVYETILPFTLR